MNNYVKLSSICKISGRVGWRGYTVDDLRSEGPWVIGANDITDDNILDLSEAKHISREKFEESPDIKIELNDILIVKVGSTIGKIAIVDRDIGEACINPNTVLLKNCTIDPYYLFYYLISSAGQQYIKNHSSASAQPALNQTDLKEMPINVVDVNVQNKISRQLKAFNKKIAINNKINQELEALAKTIYDYWFVQFDFPDQNGKPYKTSGGKMVHNAELKREIPEGWEVAELGNFIDSKRGVSYSGKDINGEGIPMINLNSFNTDSTYKFEGIKFFSGSYNQSKVLKPLDLVMCNTQQTAINPKTDIIGKSFLVPDIFDGEIVSSHHITTIVVQKQDLKYYLNALFNTEYFHRYISGYATGTNILGLHFSGVTSYKAEIPDDTLLRKFASLIENIEKRKSITLKENQRLSELRDWLLPMLMNGQATVRSPEEIRNQSEAKVQLGMVAEESEKYGKL